MSWLARKHAHSDWDPTRRTDIQDYFDARRMQLLTEEQQQKDIQAFWKEIQEDERGH